MLTKGHRSAYDANHSPTSFPEARQVQCEPIAQSGAFPQESYPGGIQVEYPWSDHIHHCLLFWVDDSSIANSLLTFQEVVFACEGANIVLGYS